MLNPFALFRRLRRGEPDFAAEIQAHLVLEEDRLVAEGWSRADAAYEARRRFGNVTSAQERHHDSRHVSWLEDGLRDIGFAVRTLARDKAYVLGAVVALGLGLTA